MISKIAFVALLLLIINANSHSQTSIDSLLISVENNNKTLVAQRQFWESKKLEFKTGLTLPNPKLEYEYLFGSPEAAGNQSDFIAVQSFDWPSVYRKRKELALAQGAQADYSIALDRQRILLDAKLSGIELVYRNKLRSYTLFRQRALLKLTNDYQEKLDRGNGNILDVNKAKLQLLQVTQLLRTIEAEAGELNSHLNQLNGGIPVVLDTFYPTITNTISFEQMLADFQSKDPGIQQLMQEKRIAEKELALAKTWRLPQLEAGYRYQGILGQRFNGIHTGITLPLWEQRNRVEHREAQMIYKDLQIQDHSNIYSFELKKLYDLQASYRELLDDYREAFAGISSISLLDKALALGEITIIEYFLETSFYYNTMTNFLETEKLYHEAVAKLFKYKL